MKNLPTANSPIRCGDAVLHHPTGEKWLVAYADYENDTIAWAGWPDGRAKLSDCERVRVATDEEHDKWVSEWLDKKRRRDGDHRPAVIERLYRTGAST